MAARHGLTPRAGTYAGDVVVQAARKWMREHPWRADGVLAAVLFAFSADEVPGGPAAVRLAAVAVSALLAATVIPRRRHPVAAFTAAAVIGAAQLAFGLRPAAPPPVAALQPTATDLVFAVLLYTVAACRPRRFSITGLVACLLGCAVAIAQWAPAHSAHPAAPVFGAAAGCAGTALAAWVLGDSMAYRYRRAYYAWLEERAARLQAERDAQARIAATAQRARELHERRARAIDESAARLRRIERDLHDGVQVRLAALAMTLGEIKEYLDEAPGADAVGHIRMLAGKAHRNAKDTLTELRDLARGIHPPVLDRGLGAALAVLAETSVIPVAVSARISARPSPAIEAIAYFCAAELIANVAKHSCADHVTITVTDEHGRLRMTVTDNGDGEARLVPGGGIAGLADRVQTVDGRFGLDSPAGGPTTITIDLPGHA